jgi:hypothetical protein
MKRDEKMHFSASGWNTEYAFETHNFIIQCAYAVILSIDIRVSVHFFFVMLCADEIVLAEKKCG